MNQPGWIEMIKVETSQGVWGPFGDSGTYAMPNTNWWDFFTSLWNLERNMICLAGRRSPLRWRAPNWATCRETRRRGRLSSASTGLCPRIPSMHKTTTMCENAQDNYDVWTFSLRKESYMWQLKMWKEIYVPIISSSGLSSVCFERLCECACHGFVTDVSTSLDCMIRCSIIGSLLSAD